MDANTDVVIEVWKYDPALLSKDGMVDPLSLTMSFEDEEDERVQDAIEELLDTVKNPQCGHIENDVSYATLGVYDYRMYYFVS